MIHLGISIVCIARRALLSWTKLDEATGEGQHLLVKDVVLLKLYPPGEVLQTGLEVPLEV